jgi:chemotaxis response regulator CheB
VKRICVLSQQSLFGKGVEALLSRESGIEIIRWKPESMSARECIRKSTPDIVIIDCDDSELDLSPVIRCIFSERPGICILGLSLQHNEISIYRGEQKEVLQVADLMKIIGTEQTNGV